MGLHDRTYPSLKIIVLKKIIGTTAARSVFSGQKLKVPFTCFFLLDVWCSYLLLSSYFSNMNLNFHSMCYQAPSFWGLHYRTYPSFPFKTYFKVASFSQGSRIKSIIVNMSNWKRNFAALY